MTLYAQGDILYSNYALGQVFIKEGIFMESKFTGGLAGLIGTKILQFLIIVFTLGLGVPWAVCKKQRWIASHTIIDGNQVKFTGTGGGLFGQYIKWFILSIITLGIYSLWIPIKMQKWVTEHTHVDVVDIPNSSEITIAELEIIDNNMSCPRCNETLKISLACSNCGTLYTNPYCIAEVFHLGEEEQYNPSKVTQKDKVKIVKCRVCDGEVKILDGKDIARCSVCGKPYKIIKKVE